MQKGSYPINSYTNYRHYNKITCKTSLT